MLLFLVAARAATWEPCVGIDTARQAECASFAVPEDYGQLGEGQSLVNVTVARLPSPRPATRHLWIAAPDVGTSALAELTYWAERPLPDDIELYAVEHRGVGANRLLCPEQEAATSAGGALIDATEIGACGDHLAASVDALAFIDTTQSGGDLMELSEQLKGPEVDVFFVGSGYGAFLLQRSLVLSGRPEGVILDGPWPADASLSDLDTGLNDVARRVLAACDADTDCADRMGDVEGGWSAAFRDQGVACEAFDDPTAARRTLADLAGGPPELQALVPVVVQRAVRCKRADVDTLRHLQRALADWNDHPGTSPAAALHLAYGELWRGDAPADDGFVASTGVAVTLDRGRSEWSLPFAPSAPRYPDHPRPVLLLHPEAAPLADPSVGMRYPYRDHHEVTVPGAFGPVTDTSCGLDLLIDFLDAPELPPAGCDSSLDFVGSAAIDQRWLGTEDRWESSGCGCQQASPWAWGATFSRRRATPRRQSR